MGQIQRVSKNNTTITHDSEGTHINLHNTVVVSFNNKSIKLNSDGWTTATTKARMNQCSNQFGLGYSVYQKNFEWYVDYNGETIEFSDNMILNR